MSAINTYRFHSSMSVRQCSAVVIQLRKDGFSAWADNDLHTDATRGQISLSTGNGLVIEDDRKPNYALLLQEAIRGMEDTIRLMERGEYWEKTDMIAHYKNEVARIKKEAMGQ